MSDLKAKALAWLDPRFYELGGYTVETLASLTEILESVRDEERAAAEKRADAEAARWQQRIHATIVNAGIEPCDPSGNDSGDPLDWTDCQVAAVLRYEKDIAAEARAEEREACAALVDAWAPWGPDATGIAHAIRKRGEQKGGV